MREESRQRAVGQWLRQRILPDNWLDAVLALVLALESLLVFCRGCGWLEDTEIYRAFSVTAATWTAVNKTAELRLLNVLLFGLPIGWALYSALLRGLRVWRARTPWLDVLPVCVLALLWQRAFPWRTIVVLALLCGTGMLLLTQQKLSPALVGRFLLTELLLQYVCTILLQLAYAWTGAAFLAVLVTPVRLFAAGLGVLVAIGQTLHPSERFLNTCWRGIQLGMPLVFLYAWRFVYQSSETGGTTTLYPSIRWTVCCLLLFAGCMGIAIVRAYRRDNGLWVSTMVSAAAALTFCLPCATILTDWFHYGEYAVSTQQLLQFGSLPFVDCYPIHGLCDYVYSGAAALFFDGSFAALTPGVVCGNCLVVCGMAFVVWRFAAHKEAAFLGMVVLLDQTVFTASGYNYCIRWIIGFLTVYLLNSPSIRRSALSSVIWWVWLSMLGILWNPSIGGVLAIAYVPVLLRRCLCAAGRAEFAALRTGAARRSLMRRGIPLVLAGLCYLPVFAAVVRFILENTGTTTETNGSIMLSATDFSLWFADDHWLRKFLGVLFLMGFVGAAWLLRRSGDRARAWEAVGFTAVCTPLLANYIFVRYDDGDRAVFYWMMLAACFAVPLLWQVGRQATQSQSKRLCVLGGTAVLAVCLFAQQRLPIGMPAWYLQRDSIPADAQSVDGTSIGLSNLGEGYLDGSHVQLAASYAALTKAVCTQPDDRVFNGTTNIALTVLAGQQLATRYTSLYNISNPTMQANALAELSAHPPKLILLQNGALIDNMTTAMRSFSLYRWWTTQGYRPYTYQGLLFLTNGDDLPPEATLNWFSYFTAMQLPNLGSLPRIWAQAEPAKDLQAVSVPNQTITDCAARRLRQTVTFDAPLDGMTCDFVRLDVAGLGAVEGCTGRLRFSYAVNDQSGTTELRFTVTEGSLLIPVSMAPTWMLSHALTGMTVSVETESGQSLCDGATMEVSLLANP